jgi:hypothetical protein
VGVRHCSSPSPIDESTGLRYAKTAVFEKKRIGVSPPRSLGSWGG